MHEENKKVFEASEEYKKLHEASNEHHNAVYAYIEKHGVDDYLKVAIQGKYQWLKLIAEKYGIELE